MIAVIFEVEPREGMLEPYLDIAAELKPRLEAIDGFISVERFASLTTPGKYVSLSFWRDEAAVIEWRRQAHHRLRGRGPSEPDRLPGAAWAPGGGEVQSRRLDGAEGEPQGR